MPTAKRPRDVVADAITSHLAPFLKERGFRKRAFVFQRKKEATDQFLSVQLSSGGEAFYVNVGMTFEAVRALEPKQVGAVMLGGQPMDYAVRLEEIVPGTPAVWAVEATTDPETLGKVLRSAVEAAVNLLDRVSGAEGMLATFPLDEGFSKVLRAQLRYSLGDHRRALEDMQAVADEFADRKGCNLSALLSRAGLHALDSA